MAEEKEIRRMTALTGRLKFYAVFLLLSMVLLSGCDRPQPTSTELADIDTSKEPLQTRYDSNELITMQIEDGLFKIKPLAKYNASVKVVSKESYAYGWAAKLSPVDLAVVWGRLANPESEKYITYSQRDRWYYFEPKPENPFTTPYIINHSSNNHIIPSTENIRKAVKYIKVNRKIVLEGFLVNMAGTYEGQPVWWNTSLSRSDTGDHSCELFYVTKVRIGDEVYQ